MKAFTQGGVRIQTHSKGARRAVLICHGGTFDRAMPSIHVPVGTDVLFRAKIGQSCYAGPVTERVIVNEEWIIQPSQNKHSPLSRIHKKISAVMKKPKKTHELGNIPLHQTAYISDYVPSGGIMRNYLLQPYPTVTEPSDFTDVIMVTGETDMGNVFAAQAGGGFQWNEIYCLFCRVYI
ncbi:putative adhesin [Limoniibacter endophyticus]|nr:hypothetical protein [Limoniibacter endophyticus]